MNENVCKGFFFLSKICSVTKSFRTRRNTGTQVLHSNTPFALPPNTHSLFYALTHIYERLAVLQSWPPFMASGAYICLLAAQEWSPWWWNAIGVVVVICQIYWSKQNGSQRQMGRDGWAACRACVEGWSRTLPQVEVSGWDGLNADDPKWRWSWDEWQRDWRTKMGREKYKYNKKKVGPIFSTDQNIQKEKNI